MISLVRYVKEYLTYLDGKVISLKMLLVNHLFSFILFKVILGNIEM